jgi:hypothetical protein
MTGDGGFTMLMGDFINSLSDGEAVTNGHIGYAKENTTFSGIRQPFSHGFPDPLRAFSDACHEELKTY